MSLLRIVINVYFVSTNSFGKANVINRTAFSILAISMFSSLSYSQEYVHGIAPDSIDLLNTKAKQDARDAKFEDAINAYKVLQDYWSKEFDESGDRVSAINYFLSFSKYYWNKMEVKVTKNEVDFVLSKEQEILAILTESDLVTYNYYRLCGRLVRQINGEKKQGLVYLRKAADILNETAPERYDLLSEIMVNIGNNQISTTNYDEALRSYQEAQEYSMMVKPIDYFLLYKALYAQSGAFFYKSNYTDALDKVEEALEISRSHLNNPKSEIKMTRSIGLLNYQQGKFKKALPYFLKALAANKREYGGNTPDIPAYYEVVSNTYLRLGDHYKGIMYIDSALMIIDRLGTNKRAAILLNNKAALNFDPNTKIKLLTQALDICPNELDCDDEDENLILVNLGEAYRLKGNYHAALNYNLLSKQFYEDNYEKFGNRLNIHYASLALIYVGLNDIESAIEYQHKAIDSSRDFRPEESPYIAEELARLGSLYILADDLNAAEEVLNQALKTQENIGGITEIATIMTKGYLSKVYTKTNRPSAAKNSLLSALNPLLKDKRREPLLRNEYLADLTNLFIQSNQIDSAKITLSQLLKFNDIDEKKLNSFNPLDVSLWSTFNAYIEYLQIYEQLNNESPEIIEKVELGLKMATKLKENYFFESSEIEFQKKVRDFIDWSLERLSKQWYLTKDDHYLNLMFTCIEFDKSIFSSVILSKNALKEELISEKYLLREKYLIQEYENIYQKFNTGTFNLSDSTLLALQEDMLSVQQKKEDFLDSLKVLYPEYYNNKYNPTLSSLSTIAKKAKDNNIGFLNYYWNDTLLHCLSILPNCKEYFVINTADSDDTFNRLNSLVTSYNSNERMHRVIKQAFVKHSNEVYSILFSNFDKHELPFELIIIPDGKLVYLSFDMLIDSIPNEEFQYKNLPFLIHKHLFSYVGSCSEYVSASENNYEFASLSYLGFSPEYLANSISETVPTRNAIKPLLYNSLEIKNGEALFGGEIFNGTAATESNFKKSDTENKILHLAMHTTIDDRYPQDSYLNFTVDSSSIEDGKLHIFEIAKMNLDARLVILSACETNKGKEINGQGVLGIARAFQKASCPNIILSNWSIDDRSTSDIVSSCLRYIKKNFTPSHALRQAKLEFIENSSTLNSHPKYWAAFSYYGNSNSYPRQQNLYASIAKLLSVLGLVLLSLFLYKRFYKPNFD